MTVRKPDHSLRYYVCPQNMNNARFVCEFKGINAQELETSVLATCQDFFQNQQLYSKINHAIQQRLKRQRDIETKTTLNHEQLIEKLAQAKLMQKRSENKRNHYINNQNLYHQSVRIKFEKLSKTSFNNVSR